MRSVKFVLSLVILLTSSACAQILYEEHFTNGVMALDWHATTFSSFICDSMGVTTDPNNPSGDGWIGFEANTLASSVGLTYAGDVGLTDYTLSAYVYTKVMPGSTGPYNSLVFRYNGDPDTLAKYYLFDADFDNDHRLRFRKRLTVYPEILHTWTSTQIPGGAPTVSGWHQMSVRMQNDQFWFYWDGQELPDCPVIDGTPPLFTNGYFGVYNFNMNNDDSTKVDDVIAQIGGGGTLSVTLLPYGAPIIIPATGGSFNYNIAVNNGTSSTQTFDGWTMVTLPNGLQYGPLLGPLNITLPASISINRDRTQNVPGSAPPGQYVYRAYVGQYPFTITDTDFFNFTKATVGGETWVENWENAGEALVAAERQTLVCTAQPNPFNPTTAISFELRAASFVHLKVYDTVGRLVATLVDGWNEAGDHEVTFDGSALTSGVYLYRLQAGDMTSAGKMLLVK